MFLYAILLVFGNLRARRFPVPARAPYKPLTPDMIYNDRKIVDVVDV
jgi:hypothetical protein